MKFVIAPDSYKGSLTASKVGETMAKALLDEMPQADVRIIPMADGGEGTVDALVQAAGGQTVPVQATGALGEPVDTYVGVIGGHSEASVIIEVANIFGLPMVDSQRRNPMNTTSRGLGDAIRFMLDQGLRRFVIGLGGSATNDGGLGMLSALGVRFTCRSGRTATGFGRELAELTGADWSGLDPRLKECRLTIACDVTNPLLGPQGASYVFGPQKGATPEQVASLDQALAAYADLVEATAGPGLRDRAGAGAAGGLGFALLALGAAIVPGAQVVEEMTSLQRYIAEADWVITGEGRSDGQTLFGKLPLHVAQTAKAAGKQAILISGSLGDESERLNEHFAGCFSIVRGPASLRDCLEHAEFNLYECTRNIARLLKVSQKSV